MTKSDPALYASLLRPFQSMDASSEAIEAFFEEVGELRKKHGIPNVILCVDVNATCEDGKVGTPMACCQFGDYFRAPVLAAVALGDFQKGVNEHIAKLSKPRR